MVCPLARWGYSVYLYYRSRHNSWALPTAKPIDNRTSLLLGSKNTRQKKTLTDWFEGKLLYRTAVLSYCASGKM